MNITCPKCRYRHPANRSCAEAAQMAADARALREAREWAIKQFATEDKPSTDQPNLWDELERQIRQEIDNIGRAYENRAEQLRSGPGTIAALTADYPRRIAELEWEYHQTVAPFKALLFEILAKRPPRAVFIRDPVRSWRHIDGCTDEWCVGCLQTL